MHRTKTLLPLLAATGLLVAAAPANAQDPVEVTLQPKSPVCLVLVETNFAIDRFYHCYGAAASPSNPDCTVAYSTGQAPGQHTCVAVRPA